MGRSQHRRAARSSGRAGSWTRTGLLFLLIASLAGAMLWVFDRSRQVEVPIPPDLSGADPEIASFIRQRAALVESHRVDAAAWAALGMAYEANGFDAASKRCYEQAVAIKPDEAKWWYRLAITQAR